jgi:hypothetical protein
MVPLSIEYWKQWKGATVLVDGKPVSYELCQLKCLIVDIMNRDHKLAVVRDES